MRHSGADFLSRKLAAMVWLVSLALGGSSAFRTKR